MEEEGDTLRDMWEDAHAVPGADEASDSEESDLSTSPMERARAAWDSGIAPATGSRFRQLQSHPEDTSPGERDASRADQAEDANADGAGFGFSRGFFPPAGRTGSGVGSYSREDRGSPSSAPSAQDERPDESHPASGRRGAPALEGPPASESMDMRSIADSVLGVFLKSQDKYAYIFDGIQRAHAPDVHSSHGLLAGPDPGLDERTGRQVMATTSHAGGAEASRWPASASELAELHASFNAATSRAYNVRRAQWTFTLFADLAQLESGAPEPGNDRIDVTNVADRVPAALGDAHRGVPWRSRLLQAHRHPAADLATAPGEEEDGGFGDELVALNSAPGTDARGDGVDSLVEGSDFGRRMRRVAAIVRWLEASARATGLPRTDRVGHWPRTTKRIRSELLHRGSVPGNGTSVDPDAPYHEHGATAAGGNDAEDDAEEEARLFRAVWQALRAGCPAEARGLTLRAGSLWQTAAMTSFGPTDPAFASRDAAAPVLHARGDPVWQMAVWRLGARAEEASGEPEDRAAVGRMGAYLRCAAAESLLAATLAGDTQRALRADGSAGWEHTLWLVFRAMQEQKEADVAAATETIAAPLHDPAHGPSLVHAYAHLRRKQSPHGAAVDARSLFLNEPVPGATFVAALAEGRAAAGVPDASRLGAHDPYALMQAAILCGSASRLAHVLDRISTAFAPANAGANDGALSGTGDADALSVKGNAGYLPGESPGIHPSPLLLVCAAHMALVTRQALRGGVARDSALFTDAASVGPAEEQALDRTLARCAAFFADPLCGRRPTLVPQYLAHVEDAGSRRSILATFFEREQDMEAREACVREARQAVLGAEGPAALESRDFVHALCRALGTQRAVEHQRVEALQHGRAPEDLWGDAASGGGDGTAPLPADERVVQSVTWIAEDPDAALDAVIQANAALRTFARRAHRLTASGAGRSRPMASSLAACTMLFSQDALMDALNTLLDEIDSVAAARRTAAGGVEHRQRLCEAASEEFSSWQLLFDGQQAFRRWIQAGTDVAGVQVQTDEFYRRADAFVQAATGAVEALDQMLRCSWPWLATVDETTSTQDATGGPAAGGEHPEYSSTVQRVEERRGVIEADALHSLLAAARACGQDEAVGPARAEELLELRQVGGRLAADGAAAAWLARAMEVADLAAGEQAAVFQELLALPEQLQRILSNVRSTSLAMAALMPPPAVGEGNPLAYAFRALASEYQEPGSR